MSDNRNEQTSIVDSARDRLARAVARAEAAEAVVGRIAEHRTAADEAAAANGELRSTLAVAHAENKALRARYAAVSKRLDAAIDQLKSVLAGPV